MDEKTKTEMILIFNQGFEEVVLPALDNLKDELKEELNTRIDKLEGKMDRFERKLDKFATDTVDHERTLKQHHVRISNLEQKIAA